MANILKKATFYFLFLTGAALFMYFSLTGGLILKIELESANQATYGKVVLNYSLGFLCLILALVMQRLVSANQAALEKKIFSYVLVFYFGLTVLADILIIVYGRSDLANTFLLALPSLVLALAEIVVGILGLLALRADKKQDEPKPENENNAEIEGK